MKLSVLATLSLLGLALSNGATAQTTTVVTVVPAAPSPAAAAPVPPAGISAWPGVVPPPTVPAELLKAWPIQGNITTTVRGTTACDAAHTTCSWTCNGCLAPDDLFQCPDKNQWGITFDDGPSEFTPLLLDFLKSKNIKATFFVIGSNVLKFPDTLRRTHAEGHQIAIHTWSHTALTSQTNDAVIAELWYTAAVINATIGVWPQYMRPPYGDIDDRVRALCKSLGLVPTIWVEDTNDWELSEVQTTTNFTPASITAEVQSWVAKKNSTTAGPITLEHDLYKESTELAISSVVPIMAAAYNPVLAFQCAGANGKAPYLGVPKVVAAANTTSSAIPVATPKPSATVVAAAGTSAKASAPPKVPSSATDLRASPWIAPAAAMLLLAAWL